MEPNLKGPNRRERGCMALRHGRTPAMLALTGAAGAVLDGSLSRAAAETAGKLKPSQHMLPAVTDQLHAKPHRIITALEHLACLRRGKRRSHVECV